MWLMSNWIVVVVLYLLGMGLFHLLGGLAAAADVLRRWGEAVSSHARNTPSSSG
jgi:hypothetical protein